MPSSYGWRYRTSHLLVNHVSRGRCEVFQPYILVRSSGGHCSHMMIGDCGAFWSPSGELQPRWCASIQRATSGALLPRTSWPGSLDATPRSSHTLLSSTGSSIDRLLGGCAAFALSLTAVLGEGRFSQSWALLPQQGVISGLHKGSISMLIRQHHRSPYFHHKGFRDMQRCLESWRGLAHFEGFPLSCIARLCKQNGR
jgi:hypothetical protein